MLRKYYKGWFQMTLQSFLELWLRTYVQPKRAPKTVDAYRYALAHLSGVILTTEIGQLSPMAIQAEVNELAAIYPRQAQLMHQALRSALKRAEKLEMIDRTPMDRVDPPAHETAEIKPLTAAEASAYYRECMSVPSGVLLACMLVLGLRRNEARALRYGDMDADGVLHIRHQRTKEGLAPLKSRASRRDLVVPEALRPHFDGPTGEYLVDISASSLRRQHRRVLAAIGAEGVTLHGLRHTAATLAAAGGVHLATLQHQLGHRHVSTTADFYIHPSLAALARCTYVVYNTVVPLSGARLEIV